MSSSPTASDSAQGGRPPIYVPGEYYNIINGITKNEFDDERSGTAGADAVTLLSGSNHYRAQAGDDLVLGNAGRDRLYGNQGADTLYGGQDEDTLHGGQGNDVLYGDRDNDLLLGELGNDTLIGGTGDDTLVGGVGADRYVFGPNSGLDVILDFNPDEGDRLDLQGQTVTGMKEDRSSDKGPVIIDTTLTLSGGGSVVLAGFVPLPPFGYIDT